MAFAVGTLPKVWHKKISRIILSPGIALNEAWLAPFRQAGIEIIGDIELFARSISQPVIAVTGSNGKSTVCTLVSEFLQQGGYQVGLGGNIGTPVLDLLLDEVEHDVYVLELSSFQLETTYSLHSISSALLNISEDHMDRYSSLAEYLQAKTSIYNDTELAVVPQGEDARLWLTHNTAKVHFGLQPPLDEQDYGLAQIGDTRWLVRGQQPYVALDMMHLNAPHHQLNALAAMALCQPFALAPEVFAQVLAQFSGLAHRTQLVCEHQGVRWVNDSKGTNVGATLAALSSLAQGLKGGKIILLAGGVGKDADFSPLLEPLNLYAKQLILFGRDAPRIRQALNDGLSIDCCEVTDLQQAVAQAQHSAEPGDMVLLSPACASFDQFSDYRQRGEQFVAWVEQLASATPENS